MFIKKSEGLARGGLVVDTGSMITVRFARLVRSGTLVGVCLLSLSGCGENQEELNFRKTLIEKAVNDETRKMGEAFLAQNAKRQDVKVSASGLQYEILQTGYGPSPHPLDTVTVHYQGSRVDGLVFDSSYERKEPANLPLNKMIKGWQEGLSMMNKGAVWMLYVPPELAYSTLSPSLQIPANSTLIFKVELLDFKAPEIQE